MSKVRDERGSVTLWVLGLLMPTLLLGGLAFDLWRGFSERRALVSIADAAAVAGANGVDTDYFYETDRVRLDPDLADQLARDNLAVQLDDRALNDWEVEATTASVTVRIRGSVGLTLLKLFYDETWDIEADSTARPQPIG